MGAGGLAPPGAGRRRLHFGDGGRRSTRDYRLKTGAQFALGLTLALAVCAAAEAQRHRPREATITVVAPSGPRVVSTGDATRALAASGTVAAPRGSNVEALLHGFPAPGLGFDFTHHAAVNRNLGTRALIDPVTQLRLQQAREIRRQTPFVPVPAVFPASINNFQVIVLNQPPPVVVLQVPAAEEPEREDERFERVRYLERVREPEPPRSRPAPVDAPAPSSARLRESSDLVLIRKDGTIAFAVGFLLREDKLIYVTREGFRLSMLLSLLDVDATREMNESLGTTLRLPGT